MNRHDCSWGTATTTFAELNRSAYEESKKDFGLLCPASGGGSQLAHLQAAARQTGRTVEEMAGDSYPRYPDEIKYLVPIFHKVGMSRTHGPGGSNPIQYTEIESWARMNGIEIEPQELELIKTMDAAYLEVTNGRLSRNHSKS